MEHHSKPTTTCRSIVKILPNNEQNSFFHDLTEACEGSLLLNGNHHIVSRLQHLTSKNRVPIITGTSSSPHQFDSHCQSISSIVTDPPLLQAPCLPPPTTLYPLPTAHCQSNVFQSSTSSWWKKPHSFLIITKDDKTLIPRTRELVDYLLSEGVVLDGEARTSALKVNQATIIYIEDTILSSITFHSSAHLISSCVKPWNAQRILDGNAKMRGKWVGRSDAGNRTSMVDGAEIDFVITLGGDGTVLYASWLFQFAVPPVLSFFFGTLGFLTLFDFEDYKQIVGSILRGNDGVGTSTDLSPSKANMCVPKISAEILVTLRMRLTCSVVRVSSPPLTNTLINSSVSSIQDDLVGGEESNFLHHPYHPLPTTVTQCSPEMEFRILNDLVVDRGPSPYMCKLEVYGDGRLLTTVQADGLVLSTPTGSTAYSVR